MKLSEEDLLIDVFEFTQGIFDICCQSKDMENFHNSQA